MSGSTDAIDLQSQVKQAHWNVKGPHFIALHELFDKISDAMLEQIDEVAERITSLGGTAEGTVAVAAGRSKLKNYPLSITRAGITFLSIDPAVRLRQGDPRRHRRNRRIWRCRHGRSVHQLSRETDKYLWFLEAHLQDKA